MLQPTTLYSSSECRVDHFCSATPSRAVAFTFTAMSHTSLDGMGWAGELLTANGFNVIAFKTAADKWYQNIPHETLSMIAAYADTRDYNRRVAYGGSMGGFAAIAFSSRFAFEEVLAYAPQYRIDQEYDTRWRDLSNGLEWIHAIEPSSVSTNCRYTLVYDNKSTDRLHIDHIRGLIDSRQLSEIKLPYAGHLVGEFLRDIGSLKGLTLAVLNGRPVDLPALRKGKHQSNHYLCGLAEAALAKNKPAVAMRLIDSAITIDPQNAYYRILKSNIAVSLGDRQTAIASAKQAILLAPSDPTLLLFLSDLLADEGLVKDAVVCLDQALAHLPGNEWVMQKRADLLAKDNFSEAAV